MANEFDFIHRRGFVGHGDPIFVDDNGTEHPAALIGHDTQLLIVDNKAEEHPLGTIDAHIRSHVRSWEEWFRTGVSHVPLPKPKDLPIPGKAVRDRRVDAPDAEYAQLATKLGLKPTVLLEAQLEQVLAEEMIPIYDYAKVEEYLDNECLKAGLGTHSWAWYPLRKRDRSDVTPEHKIRALYPRAKPIPKAALLTMAAIAERMPEAKFFVSDIQQVLDPFMGVTVAGSTRMWVLERWDEPGFRS